MSRHTNHRKQCIVWLMRQAFTWAIVFVAISEASASARTVRITGRVTNTADEPLAQVAVTVSDREGRKVQAQTDANGDFSASFDTPAASVRCMLALDGYEDAFYILVVRGDSATVSTVHLKALIDASRPAVSAMNGGGLLVDTVVTNRSAETRTLNTLRIKGSIGTDELHAQPTTLIMFKVDSQISVTTAKPDAIDGAVKAQEEPPDAKSPARDAAFSIRYRESGGGSFEVEITQAVPIPSGSAAQFRFVIPQTLEGLVTLPGQISRRAKVEIRGCVSGGECKDDLRIQFETASGATITSPAALTHTRLIWEN
jgi:hypothetical protein